MIIILKIMIIILKIMIIIIKIIIKIVIIIILLLYCRNKKCISVSDELTQYHRGSSSSNHQSINTFKESAVRTSGGSLFQSLILLKFIDIFNFLMLHFGAMNLLLFLV